MKIAYCTFTHSFNKDLHSSTVDYPKSDALYAAELHWTVVGAISGLNTPTYLCVLEVKDYVCVSLILFRLGVWSWLAYAKKEGGAVTGG